MRCTLLSTLALAAAAVGAGAASPSHAEPASLSVRALAHPKLSGKAVGRRAAGAKRQPASASPLDSLPLLGAAGLANVVPASNLAGLAARDTAAVTNLLTSVTQVTKGGDGATQLTSFTSLLTTVTRGQSSSSKQLQQYAKQAKSSPSSRDNSAFQNSVYNQLKAYRAASSDLTGLSALADALAPMRKDVGLKNFNREDDVQVLLRTTVTGMMDTLEAVNLIVYHVPLLGPVLGPIVYDLKCIIDSTLMLGEETIDGLLNELYPQLHTLSGSYLSSACAMGPSLPFCV